MKTYLIAVHASAPADQNPGINQPNQQNVECLSIEYDLENDSIVSDNLIDSIINIVTITENLLETL